MKPRLKTIYRLLSGIGLLIGACCATAQSATSLDLSTRCTGVPPSHTTVSSVAQWMQNPVEQKLEIAVTNLYADANAYMEIDIAGRRLLFHGAGQDALGNYIPTNYAPVRIDATLRREYPMSIMCPNSGPNGSPLFKLSDFWAPDDFITFLTNAPTDAVSAFLWANFTPQGRYVLTNETSTEELRQTNLVEELNRILEGPSIFDSQRFLGVTPSPDTQALLDKHPQSGQDLIRLNRLLLQDAYWQLEFYWLPSSQPDNSGTAEITFSIQPPQRMTISKVKPAPQYSVLINGVEQQDGSPLILQHPTDGDVSTNRGVVEVLKNKFGHYGLGDGCDDATKAPGQGTWLSIGPGCTQDTNRISIQWSVSLGRTFDGLAAGQLAMRAPGLSPDVYTPLGIFYNGSMTNLYAELPLGTPNTPFVPANLYASVVLVTTNIPWLVSNSASQVYTNSDNPLRQIKSCQAFVDILTPDTNQTVLKFYHPDQVGTNQNEIGLYTNIVGSPFVSWTIQNPHPGTTDNLLIIENRNGNVSTQSLAKAASAGGVTWTLTEGSDSTTRVETRQVSFIGSPATDRVEQDTVSYAGSGTPAYQCQETYHFYDWGAELAQTSVPNGSSPLLTTYTYYNHDDPDNDPNNYGCGQLALITYPDGYWERRLYWVDLYGVYFYFPMVLIHPYAGQKPDYHSDYDLPGADNTSMELYSLASSSHQYSFELHDGVPIADSEAGTIKDGEYLVSYRYQTPADSACRVPTTANYDWDIADSDPPGLAGHTAIFQTPLYRRHSFYDHGVFDPFSNTFALVSTNHLYTWDAITNRNPDHLETRIDEVCGSGVSVDVPWPFVIPGDVPGYRVTLDDYTEVDGHPVVATGDTSRNPGLPYGGVARLRKGATRKHASIYHKGSLAQTEEYAYTGPGSTDPYTTYCSDPQWALLSKLRYYVDSLGRPTNVTRIDPLTSATRVIYTADYRDGSGHDGGLLRCEAAENGQQISYTYDSLQRVKTKTVKGYGSQPDQMTTYTYDANGHVLSEVTTAGSLSQSQSWAYDMAGRVTNQVDQSGIDTQTSYSADNRSVTATSPGDIAITQTSYVDRTLQSVTGNGTVPRFYTCGATLYPVPYYGEVGHGMREQTTCLGHANSPRWTTQGTDYSGNADAWLVQPIGGGTTNTISRFRHYCANRLWVEYYNYPNGNYYNISYNYDQDGEVCLKQLAIPYTESRETGSIRRMITIDGSWYEATTNLIALADGGEPLVDLDYAMTVQSIHLEQLNGFSGNEAARSIDYDADSNQTITTTYLDRSQNKVTVVTTQPATSSLSATSLYQNGLLLQASTLSVPSPVRYAYDALGRTNQVQDSLGFTSKMTYNSHGWLASVTDPAGNTTTYDYYGVTEANAGKLKCQTDPNGKKTYHSYTPRGELFRVWGEVPYPAEYHYNEYGDLTNLVTFRGGIDWTGSSWPTGSTGAGDNTYWVYDEASGALLKKIDAQSRATTYAYYPESGRLFTRSWTRAVGSAPVTVTNRYDTTRPDLGTGVPHDDGAGFGDLVEQDYNDGTPSVVYASYSRAGLPRAIFDGAGAAVLAYDYASRLVSTSYTNGPLTGITVSNHFNPFYGRDSLCLQQSNNPLIQQSFSYDPYGRLGAVSSGPYSAQYTYVANSDLLRATTCENNGSPALTTTRTWEYGMRLHSIANVANGATVTSHTYRYDALNRRTRATLEDGSMWNYAYNDRSELVDAHRYWPDWAPVAGQQFAYDYDNIGNRKSASSGGDVNGSNLRQTLYQANSLNQYTCITNPGYASIIGAAWATNTVMVGTGNGNADRKGEYFHQEISIANGSGPVWQNVGITSGGVTTNGGLVFPANSQTNTYDLDGNLTFDGTWTYQWDAENRLVAMCMTNLANVLASLPNSNRLRLDFTYDYQGRRMSKTVSSWNGQGGFANPVTTLFVYDGWNLLAELSTQHSPTRTYMWGLDLSGTIDQAGGVGGLLMMTTYGQGTTNCFVSYDGNGNVTALTSAAGTDALGRYEYSPFGELLRATGPMSEANPFRFSTKYLDHESGHVYYGYRYFSPSHGKWIGRDAVGEGGGVNLYAFAINNPIMGIDTLGNVAIWVTDILHIDADPSRGAHVHDIGEGVAYAFGTDADGNLTLTSLAGHEGEFDLAAAQRSLRGIMQNPEAFQALQTANASLWRGAAAAGKVGRITQGTVRAIGKAIKGVGRAAGVACAVLAIAQAAHGAQEVSNSINDYAKDAAAGESAYMDLDAVQVAIGVQDMTGNYFTTMDVLGLLLQ